MTNRAVQALALALLSGVLQCCRQDPADTARDDELVVISPMDETVRYEVSLAFEGYAKRKAGRDVSIRWQPARGTGNIMRFLENEIKSAQAGRAVNIDVFFGGGPAHEKARKMGMTEPAALSEEALAAVPQKLGGVNLRDPSAHWFGVTVSSFGIIYSRNGLANRGMEEPTSWKDLADPSYSNLLVIADPMESGSARACYEMILQCFGWEEGWRILLRILANAGSFTHSSGDIVREISSGQAVAGMVIDTYAFAQIEKDGGDFTGFVLPRGETTFTPDPVSIIKGTPRKELAQLFIEFLLSREGQSLWFLPPGAPGGPEKYSLWHFPVRPDVYAAYAGRTTLKDNPFEAFATLEYDEKKGAGRSRVLTFLFETAAVQNKARLKKAWRKIQLEPDEKLIRLFDEMPLGEKEGFELMETIRGPVETELEEEKYFRFFKDKYEEIIKN
ncbi:MAG: extracellular solute-binding protein [Pseudomonadota bacterium]